jgi:hypothetical protein
VGHPRCCRQQPRGPPRRRRTAGTAGRGGYRADDGGEGLRHVIGSPATNSGRYVVAVGYGYVVAVRYVDSVRYGNVVAVRYGNVVAVGYGNVVAVGYGNVVAVRYGYVVAVRYVDSVRYGNICRNFNACGDYTGSVGNLDACRDLSACGDLTAGVGDFNACSDHATACSDHATACRDVVTCTDYGADDANTRRPGHAVVAGRAGSIRIGAAGGCANQQQLGCCGTARHSRSVDRNNGQNRNSGAHPAEALMENSRPAPVLLMVGNESCA